MVLLLLADGFEEIEALTPVDLLRRTGIEVKTVGVYSKIAVSSHSIPVICDLTTDEVDLSLVDTVILPGGMPGAINLDKSPFVDQAIKTVYENGGRLAAICAAPLVLGRRGLLKGVMATCYPGFENELIGAVKLSKKVVTDKKITTAVGMGASLEFAKELVSLLVSKEKAEELSRSVME